MLEKSSFRYQARGATARQEGIKAKQTAQWGGATLKLSAKSNLNTPLNVRKGGGQTYHQYVFFRSLHGALIWNRSKTGSILVNEGDRWVIFPLGVGFGDKIITRWSGEGWKQTVRAARLKAQKVVGALRRVRLFQSAAHYGRRLSLSVGTERLHSGETWPEPKLLLVQKKSLLDRGTEGKSTGSTKILWEHRKEMFYLRVCTSCAFAESLQYKTSIAH